MNEKYILSLYIGNQIHDIEVTRKRRQRNMYLRVKGGEIKVSCPFYTPQSAVESFIRTKELWILKSLQDQYRKEQLNKEGVNGPIIYIFGEKKYVRYEQASRDSVVVDGDILTFYLKEQTDERITKAFRKYAAKEIDRLVQEYRYQWDEEICVPNYLQLPTIKVQHMTSRWGVCYPSRNLIKISSRLIHYPVVSFEYVLLHEYAHLLVPNHSSRFYAIIKRYMPNYKDFDYFLK